jgi:hypothetical protein
MRRTGKYAAVTRDEGNAAHGRFPTASTFGRRRRTNEEQPYQFFTVLDDRIFDYGPIF